MDEISSGGTKAVVNSPSGPGDERVTADGDLVVFSRRTGRQRKKHLKREQQRQAVAASQGILALPYELLIAILSLLCPSDLFRLARTSRSLHDFVAEQEDVLVRLIVDRRYSVLARCFRAPVPLSAVDSNLRPALQNPERRNLLSIHQKPYYQHIPAPDPALVCTCLTCVLRWNSLCLAVDFSRWQGHLDRGEPLPIIPRGASPAWNKALLDGCAAVVARTLSSPLWHARVLEEHLRSTVRAIRRHTQNKGNKRRRFRLTAEDERVGSDAFLERSGPPTIDFPFHRDNYYMLESYLPNRGWNGELERWMYLPADQHDRDVHFASRRMQQNTADQTRKAESSLKAATGPTETTVA